MPKPSRADEIFERFSANIARVNNLLTVFEQVKTSGRGRQPVKNLDLLRAATVFLHASLEDFLRNLAIWKLPFADDESLKSIPLIDNNSKTTFHLGQLTKYRKMSVDDLISSSVEEHMSRFSTYNNTEDIARMLKSIKIDVDAVNSRFVDLDKLMTRRHHIVHQADRNNKKKQGQHNAQTIGLATVKTWIEAVNNFVQDIMTQVQSYPAN